MTSSNDDIQNFSGLDALSEYLKTQTTLRRGRGIPPLDKWNPENVGSMDLTIKANGEWWHEGGKINRQSLVDLFSTILWMEQSDDGAPIYYLKTPVQKLRIDVEDVPFLINDINVVEQDGNHVIEFVSSTGDVINLDDEHPLEMAEYQGELRPYIPVRFGMKGLIGRHVYMHLVKLGSFSEENNQTILTLNSGGKDYQISTAE